MNEKRERQSHPGWAVKFSDGTWLGGAHGWFRHDDAFFADIFDSKEEAEHYIKVAGFDDTSLNLESEAIPAWEPLCESLRHDVAMLTKANKVTPDNIFELRQELENILAMVANWDDTEESE